MRTPTQHLADIVVLLLLLIVCLGVWKHAVANRERHRVRWNHGRPYCADGSLAGTDAVCEERRP